MNKYLTVRSLSFLNNPLVS